MARLSVRPPPSPSKVAAQPIPQPVAQAVQNIPVDESSEAEFDAELDGTEGDEGQPHGPNTSALHIEQRNAEMNAGRAALANVPHQRKAEHEAGRTAAAAHAERHAQKLKSNSQE